MIFGNYCGDVEHVKYKEKEIYIMGIRKGILNVSVEKTLDLSLTSKSETSVNIFSLAVNNYA